MQNTASLCELLMLTRTHTWIFDVLSDSSAVTTYK